MFNLGYNAQSSKILACNYYNAPALWRAPLQRKVEKDQVATSVMPIDDHLLDVHHGFSVELLLLASLL
jgi:hypothetical protein